VPSAVLDSSALLAVLFEEPGSDVVFPLLIDAVISAVNAAEVQARLVRMGDDADEAWDTISGDVARIIPFDDIQAKFMWLADCSHCESWSLDGRSCMPGPRNHAWITGVYG